MEKMRTVELLKRFVPHVKPFQRNLWIVIFLMLLDVPVGILSPYLIKEAIDDALEHGSIQSLYLYAGILAALTLTSVLLGYISGFFDILFRVKVNHRLRLRLYQHLQTLSRRYYNDKETGYLMSRQLDDVASLGGVMPDVLAGAAVNVLRAAAFGFMLLYLEWHLALGAVVFAGLTFGYQYLISPPLREKSRTSRESWADLTEVLHQGISGHYLVQSTASEKREAKRFARSLHQSIRASVDREMYTLRTGRSFRAVTGLVQPLLVVAGTFLIVRTDFTVGSLFAFFLYLQQMVGAVGAIAGINPNLQNSLAALERIYEVLDTVPDVRNPEVLLRVPRLGGEIAFEQVSFAYLEGRQVLRDVSFRVPPHTMVALVGPSGAGKTTLVHLIPRFYDPSMGQILVDGRDLRTLDLRRYRQQIGIVPQDVFLFDRTIAENIAYGRPAATPQEIRAAAEAANALQFIEELEHGFDTLIGERGVKLSGGQRQRIAIARELLRDPSILIMDEATSSLDSESEALVQEALYTLLEGRTSFVIAHRLSTVIRADVIFVLDHGRIVERGTHAQLLARGGLYTRLYNSQFLRHESSTEALKPTGTA